MSTLHGTKKKRKREKGLSRVRVLIRGEYGGWS